MITCFYLIGKQIFLAHENESSTKKMKKEDEIKEEIIEDYVADDSIAGTFNLFTDIPGHLKGKKKLFSLNKRSFKRFYLPKVISYLVGNPLPID